jgi:SHS2 domain-containing protein
MPYEYLPDIAGSDVAFCARGATLEEMILAAGDAVMGVMVDDINAISPRVSRPIQVEDSAEDLLLVQVLQELLFFKDAQSLLLRLVECRIDRIGDTIRFVGRAAGEPIDPHRHHLSTDVKAVTMHRLAVKRTDAGWEGTVVVDV